MTIINCRNSSRRSRGFRYFFFILPTTSHVKPTNNSPVLKDGYPGGNYAGEIGFMTWFSPTLTSTISPSIVAKDNI